MSDITSVEQLILKRQNELTQIGSGNISREDIISLSKLDKDYAVKLSELMDFIHNDEVAGLTNNVKTILTNLNVPSINNSSFKKLESRNVDVNLQQKYGFAANYTGKDFYDAVSADISNRNFSKIEDGDIMYMPVTFNGVTRTKWMAVGVNTYDGVGDTDSGPGIVFRSVSPFGTFRMNSTNDNSVGWKGCFARSKFNSGSESNSVSVNKTTSGSLNKAINDACFGHLRQVHRYLGNAVSSDRAWLNDYAFLPQETEVFGCNHWANTDYYSTGVQFSAYAKAPNRRIVYNTESNNATDRVWWWLADPATVNGSTTFCYVGHVGYATCNYATGSGGYVVPCFYFGVGN